MEVYNSDDSRLLLAGYVESLMSLSYNLLYNELCILDSLVNYTNINIHITENINISFIHYKFISGYFIRDIKYSDETTQLKRKFYVENGRLVFTDTILNNTNIYTNNVFKNMTKEIAKYITDIFIEVSCLKMMVKQSNHYRKSLDEQFNLLRMGITEPMSYEKILEIMLNYNEYIPSKNYELINKLNRLYQD